MKKIFSLLLINCVIAMFFAFTMMNSGCTKEGPMGPAGKDGVNGKDGKDGINGTDGTGVNSCLECHTKTKMDAIDAQFAATGHTTGSRFGDSYGTRRDCAGCHNAEGFRNTALMGTDTLRMSSYLVSGFSSGKFSGYTARVYIPAEKLTCESCHSSHSSLDANTDGKDFALRIPPTGLFRFVNAPANNPMQSNTMYTDGTYAYNGPEAVSPTAVLSIYSVWPKYPTKNLTYDFTGKSTATCVRCHQARYTNQVPDITSDGTIALFANPSIHDASQGNIIKGVGGGAFEFGTGYEANRGHILAAACGTCHMGTPDGTKHGGHTFKVTDGTPEGETFRVNNTCNKCHHTDITKFDYHNVITDVKALMVTLGDKLTAKGWVMKKTNGEYDGGITSIKGLTGSISIKNKVNVPHKIVAAYLNWLFVYRDHSYGIHNPHYVKTLLTNTIAAVETVTW